MEPAYLRSAHRKSMHGVSKVGYRGRAAEPHIHNFVKETV